MYWLNFFVSLCFFLTSLSLLLGQNPSPFYHHLSQSTGLSNEFNGHFQVDSSGLLWVSSRDGLNRYDGKRVKTFRPELNGNSLDPNITSEVFEDRNHNRWFTSNAALHCILSGTDSLKSWQFSDRQNSYYYAFHLERDSLLWVIANQRLYTVNVYSNDLDTTYLHTYDSFVSYAQTDQKGKVTGLVRPLIELGSGIEVLQYTDRGIKRDSFFVSSPQTSIDTFVFYLEIAPDQTFWVPSTAGLIHFDPDQAKILGVYKDAPEKSFFGYEDAQLWQDRYVWVTSRDRGLFLFDQNEKRFIRNDSLFIVDQQILKNKTIKSVVVDPQNNLWFNVFDQGIFHANLTNPKFGQLVPLSVLSSQESFKVGSVVEVAPNEFLAAIDQKGLYRVILSNEPTNPTRFQQIEVPGCPAGEINYLYKDSDGDVWILSNSNVILWEPSSNQFKQKLTTPQFTSNLQEIAPGEFILMDFNKVYRFRKEDPLKSTTDLPGIIPDLYLPAQLFFHQSSRTLYISQGDNTLRVFSLTEAVIPKDTIQNIGIVNGFFSGKKKETIWLASSTGLYQYTTDNLSLHKVKGKNIRLNQSLTHVLEDAQGKVWLSSYGGIYRYDPRTDSVLHFTQSDGLLSMEFVENAGWVTSDGKIILGSDQGAALIDPERFSLNPNLPSIVLLELSINNQPQNSLSFSQKAIRPRLRYSQNDLTFQLAALEYSDPDNNRFRYHLIRNKQDTVLTAFSDLVQLSELSPGDYRLDCYASNSDDLWTKTPQSYYFIIRPPWYQTWWARSLGFLLLLGIIYGWYRYRLHQIKKRETFKRKEAEFKQKEAEFRQKEAEYKQLVAETETAVLRLQMNPHFIFNSLNSINSYILQKDIDTANDYLNQFARLMRMILDRSEYAYTEIAEEIELLTLYLQAESMRIGKKMTYSFEVDPNLDLDETLLPTMILQPFIENAIWHGISPKEGAGHIAIRFLSDNDHLCCEVEDNGVGRSSRPKSSFKSHQSKSISITKRRLEMLSKEHDTASELKIIDLFSEDKQPAGTKVQLFLPVLE